MTNHNNLEMISVFIRLTNTDAHSIDPDELIRISSFIQQIEINAENIHCILKLIANLTKFHFVTTSNDVCFNYDIEKLMLIALGNSYRISERIESSDTILSTSPDSVCFVFSETNPDPATDPATDTEYASDESYSDSAEMYASDEAITYSNKDSNKDSNKHKKKNVSDGDVISLANILCSKKYNLQLLAIKLINKYNVHKTSSYTPVFKAFIENKDFVSMKSFYNNYLSRNLIIMDQNRKIKEFNHKIRFYNEKIKLMKKKFAEFSVINDEIGKIDFNTGTHKYFTSLVSDIDNEYFDEFTPRNERNIIELSNEILQSIIHISIYHNDSDFIHEIIKNIEIPSSEIISALNIYFTKFNYETIYASISDGECTCCNNVVPNNVISDIDRTNIMKRISDKILFTTHRHDNGQIITKTERQHITDKWTEFYQILTNNTFDLIIDGANLGYVNTKSNGEINIKFIQNTIRDIITKTNKKVFLIIHQRHTNKIKQLVFPTNILSNLKIYTTPNNVNDDWFWLYASLYSKSFILTNDQSRDHGCMVAYQNEIKKWTQMYQIPINMCDGSIPDKVYASKNSVITPGIFIDRSIIHIVKNTNGSTYNCICVHMK